MSRSDPSPETGRLTVMFVDDEKELADVYTAWLADTHDVRTAYSGEEALGMIEDVDIVFLDRRMPGLSGDEVLDRIVERGLECRVAFVSAVEPDFEETFGYDMYLKKPVTREDLIAAVEEMAAHLDRGP